MLLHVQKFVGTGHPLKRINLAQKVNLLFKVVIDPYGHSLGVVVIRPIVRIFVSLDFSSLFRVLKVLDAPVLEYVEVILADPIKSLYSYSYNLFKQGRSVSELKNMSRVDKILS